MVKELISADEICAISGGKELLDAVITIWNKQILVEAEKGADGCVLIIPEVIKEILGWNDLEIKDMFECYGYGTAPSIALRPEKIDVKGEVARDQTYSTYEVLFPTEFEDKGRDEE